MLRLIRSAAVRRAVRACIVQQASSFRSLVAVVALIAFAAPAYAIVQSTTTTATNAGPEIKETTLTIEQPGRPTQTVCPSSNALRQMAV
jgi:hypothetical protein